MNNETQHIKLILKLNQLTHKRNIKWEKSGFPKSLILEDGLVWVDFYSASYSGVEIGVGAYQSKSEMVGLSPLGKKEAYYFCLIKEDKIVYEALQIEGIWHLIDTIRKTQFDIDLLVKDLLKSCDIDLMQADSQSAGVIVPEKRESNGELNDGVKPDMNSLVDNMNEAISKISSFSIELKESISGLNIATEVLRNEIKHPSALTFSQLSQLASMFPTLVEQPSEDIATQVPLTTVEDIGNAATLADQEIVDQEIVDQEIYEKFNREFGSGESSEDISDSTKGNENDMDT